MTAPGRMIHLALAAFLVMTLGFGALPVGAQEVARTVLALYDGREEPKLKLTRIHTMAEMPLNHLGLKVEYWDVANGLPDLKAYPGLRGILTWFVSDPFDDPVGYVGWLEAAMDQGARLAVLGRLGAHAARGGRVMPVLLGNRPLGRLGLSDLDGYTDLTYRARAVVEDTGMIGFERPQGGLLPGYPMLRKIDRRVTSHLVLRRNGDPQTDSHIVVTGPNGGMAVEGYDRYFDPEYLRKEWIINPFAFFRAAFATDEVPKPDVTTLVGRRVYFSHIDGDGWRNVTEVQPYAKDKLLSAEVVMLEAIQTHPDLPVTVGPIVGDLDPAWRGTGQSLDAAKELFALPQVEAGSHTWSHPFIWSFFQDYTRDKEEGFEPRSAEGGDVGGLLARMLPTRRADSYDTPGDVAESAAGAVDIGRYAVPRAFLQTPFDLDQEIAGSLAYMDKLTPRGKETRLIQWSGDTSPFPAAVAATRAAGARNMNGGDTRFDAEYPSYTSVSPIGVAVGDQRQIYAAGSNENTYTDLWSDRFFGFQYLARTIANTESPIRVKAFNIYYHTYSGQKQASINALKKNLDLAEASEIAPVTATTYAAIADGFYTLRLIAEGARRWRVIGRGQLATLRFDHALFSAVDFSSSRGVLGQRHFQGSLYVALDPAVAEPVVALTDTERADVEPAANPRPYLVQARWAVSGLEIAGNAWRMEAVGFGPGAMVWRVPGPGRFTVKASRGGQTLWRGEAEAGADGRLAFTVAASAIRGLTLAVAPAGS